MSDLWQHQQEDIPVFMDMLQKYGGAFICYEMGLGKTRTAIEILKLLGVNKTTIFAPITVIKSVWETQWEQWKGYNDTRIYVLDNSSTREKDLKEILKLDSYVIVMNYEALRTRSVLDMLSVSKQDLLILDESHRVKNPDSQVSRNMHSLVNAYNVYKYRLALSGTPHTNSTANIWSQVRVLNQYVLEEPDYNKFIHKYFWVRELRNKLGRIIGKAPNRFKNDQLKNELMEKFKKIAIIRKSEDCIDLPELQVIDINIMLKNKLVNEVNTLYNLSEVELNYNTFNGTIDVYNEYNDLVKVTRCLQLANGIAKVDEESDNEYIVDNTKFEYLSDHLDSFDNELVVVFGKWVSDITRIEKLCKDKKRPYFEISGKTKSDLNKWRNSKNGVIGVQLESGSEGIDLTESRIAIILSRGTSWAKLSQAVKRVFRPGQINNTIIYQYISNTIIEQAQIKALRRKIQSAQGIDQIYKTLSRR